MPDLRGAARRARVASGGRRRRGPGARPGPRPRPHRDDRLPPTPISAWTPTIAGSTVPSGHGPRDRELEGARDRAGDDRQPRGDRGRPGTRAGSAAGRASRRPSTTPGASAPMTPMLRTFAPARRSRRRRTGTPAPAGRTASTRQASQVPSRTAASAAPRKCRCAAGDREVRASAAAKTKAAVTPSSALGARRTSPRPCAGRRDRAAGHDARRRGHARVEEPVRDVHRRTPGTGPRSGSG